MSLKVVIVDDDPVIRVLHKTLVQKAGLDPSPILMENGKMALNYLEGKSNQSQPLLLLLDLQMPEINGFELLDLMKNLPNKASIFVIMLLSSVNRSDEVKASRYSNLIAYIEKPLNFGILEQVKSLEKLQPYL